LESDGLRTEVRQFEERTGGAGVQEEDMVCRAYGAATFSMAISVSEPIRKYYREFRREAEM